MAASAALASAGATAGELLALNAGNTQISFALRRWGRPWLVARFTDLNGTVLLDDAADSRVDVSVCSASLDCSDPDWNARLRSAAAFGHAAASGAASSACRTGCAAAATRWNS